MGGGAHGYLGVMLTTIEYAHASIVPYIRSLHPDILIIPAGTPNYESTRPTNDHKELYN